MVVALGGIVLEGGCPREGFPGVVVRRPDTPLSILLANKRDPERIRLLFHSE